MSRRGLLVEEKSYYPFGLVLGSISSRAVLKAKTAYAYNAGSEWEENGVEYYHTFFRKYDAQIGRFTGVDIASEEYADLTPFQFGANNPVLFNDPFGDRLPSLNTNGDGGLDSHLQDLGNDLSWERQGYDNMWGWMDEFKSNFESSSGSTAGSFDVFWNSVIEVCDFFINRTVDGDVFFTDNVPLNMATQIGELCVPYILGYASALLDGNPVSVEEILREAKSIGITNPVLNGIPFGEPLDKVVNAFFEVEKFNSFYEQINAKHPVLTGIPINETQGHAVLVIGYNSINYQYIYMDPALGTIQRAWHSTFSGPGPSPFYRNVNYPLIRNK